MSEPASAIIPDGECIFALPVLRCLGMEHRRTAVCSADPWDPIRFSRYADRFFALDPALSEAALLEALLRAIEVTKADVLLPAGQRMYRFIFAHEAELRSAIAIAPMPSPAAFEIAKDKWQLAAFCADRGLAHPETIHVDDDDRFRERVAALRFPALLKPARGSYGRGIEYFKSADDLLRAVRLSPPKREYVVQTFVPGYDIDCNVLCANGTVSAHTIQRGIVSGHGRFSPHAGIDFVENEAVLTESRRLLAALRWTGVAHIDMRFDPQDGRAWIIELNPHFGASVLGSLVAGVNFPDLACLAATGACTPVTAFRNARFVAGTAALRAIGAGLVGDTRIGARFRDTSLAFTAADPAPEIFTGLTLPFIRFRRADPSRRRGDVTKRGRESLVATSAAADPTDD